MKWVEDNHACQGAREWFAEELNGKRSMPVSKLISLLKQIDRIDWANWLVVRLMTHDQQIMYAIYAAEQVIEIYEARYPNDTRPRNAIQAAKTYMEDKTEANKDKVTHAVVYAADAAYAAASSKMRIQILNYGLGLIGMHDPKKAVEEG